MALWLLWSVWFVALLVEGWCNRARVLWHAAYPRASARVVRVRSLAAFAQRAGELTERGTLLPTLAFGVVTGLLTLLAAQLGTVAQVIALLLLLLRGIMSGDDAVRYMRALARRR